MCGVMLGILVSTKYQALAPLALLLALFIFRKEYKSYEAWFYLTVALILIPVVFACLNYSVFLNENNWLRLYKDVIFNISHYRGRHVGIESSNAYIYYFAAFLTSGYGKIGGILFVIGIGCLVYHKRYADIMFIMTVYMVLVLMLGRFNIALDRNISTAIPCFPLGIGAALRYTSGKLKIPLYGAVVGLVILNIIIYASYSYRESNLKKAECWIAENIPNGSRIFLMDYGLSQYFPKVDDNRNRVETKPPRPVLGGQNEYVVSGTGNWGRYTNIKDTIFSSEEPLLYPKQLHDYKMYISSLKLVKSFPGLRMHISGYGASKHNYYYPLIVNIFNGDMALFDGIDIYTYNDRTK